MVYRPPWPKIARTPMAIFTLATRENSQLFKMGDSLTFSLFTLFITPCFHV